MNETQQKAFLQLTLIDPVSNIISKLENNEFRNIDIRYLEEQLVKYMNLAAKTFNLNFLLKKNYDSEFFNDYFRNEFLKYFKELLKYFKTF